MLKNKTHRIISISPTSQHTSLKNGNNNQTNHNKTVTPIKQIQHTTRTNTIKSTLKPQQSQILQSTYKKQERQNQQNNIIQSVVVSAYKGFDRQNKQNKDNCGSKQKYVHDRSKLDKNQFEDKQGRKSCKQKNVGMNLDDVLNKIGKTYEDQKNNNSIQLIKKTQIMCLRQIIRQAKQLINLQDSLHSDSIYQQQTSPKNIQSLQTKLNKQISLFFANIHSQLYQKQKSLQQQLHQKIYELKQKTFTKFFQTTNLKSYIDKCQIDINSNYQKIINQLEIQQFNKIVQSYKQKLEYYIEKIKVKHTIKLNINGKIQLGLNDISIVIINEGENKSGQVCITKNNQIDQSPPIIIQKITKLSTNKQSYRQSHEKHSYAKSTLQELSNIPFSKHLVKPKKNQMQYQPRIASARGKY